jgi:hypothetical protein
LSGLFQETINFLGDLTGQDRLTALRADLRRNLPYLIMTTLESTTNGSVVTPGVGFPPQK